MLGVQVVLLICCCEY